MGTWYRTGTVAVTNGSPNVVGTGTLWASQAAEGDIFIGPDLVDYEITSITDDTHLAIKQKNGTASYAGSTLSAQAYAIIRNFTSTLPAQLASQLAALMTSYHVTMDELTAWLSGTGSVTVHDAVGNAYTVQTPAALAAVLMGRLSKSVAGGSNVTLTSGEASNLFIELTGTLTANINVIVPATARSFFFYNATSGAYTITVKTSGGTGVVVPQGGRLLIECDGTNVVDAISQVRLTGGTIDNTPIGSTTRSTVKGTAGDFSSDVVVGSLSRTVIRQSVGGDAEIGGGAGSNYLDLLVNNSGCARLTGGGFSLTGAGASGFTVPWGSGVLVEQKYDSQFFHRIYGNGSTRKLYIDATGDSGSTVVVRTGQTGSLTDRLAVEAGGNVGIGLGGVAASGRLHVSGGNSYFDGERIFIGGGANNAVINGNFSVQINFDADNNHAGEEFSVGHNQTGAGGTKLFVVDPTASRPGADNALNLGNASYRWATVYAGTGTINTSDARQKIQRGGLTDAELRAWERVQWLIYQWRDAVESKGDAARLHAGTIAQDIATAFAAEGLDAAHYGLWCEDEVFEWVDVVTGQEEIERPIVETVEQDLERVEVINGQPTLIRSTETVTRERTEVRVVVDGFGKPVMVPADVGPDEQPRFIPMVHTVTLTEKVLRDQVERQKRITGVRYGLRYDQCLVFEAAYLRHRVAALEAVVAALKGV